MSTAIPPCPQTVLAFCNKDQVLGRQKRSILEKMTPAKEPDKSDQALVDGLWVLVRAYAKRFMAYKNPKTSQRLNHQQLPDEYFPKKVVLVSQTCIWMIDGKLITSNPSDVSPELDEGWWHKLGIYHPYLFAALALGKLVERFDSPGQGVEGKILRTYENALIAISEEVNQYTKNALVEEIDLDQEKTLFHQINDLREELSMIKSVLTTQEEVWNEYMNVVEPNGEPSQQLDTNSNEATFLKRLGMGDTEHQITARQIGELAQSSANTGGGSRRLSKTQKESNTTSQPSWNSSKSTLPSKQPTLQLS